MTATPDPTRPAADPDVEALLAEHQKVSIGLTSGSPDTCRCGERVLCERGDEDVSIRRGRAFAVHQAAALAARGLSQGETVTEWVDHRAEGWHEALRWVRQQAEVTSPEYVLDRIDRAEPFNPYRQPVEDGGQ